MAPVNPAVPAPKHDGAKRIVVESPVTVAPPPPPPGPPAPPQAVPPTLLEANRIAGDKNILPDALTTAAIAASGKDKIVTSWKMCLETTGVVSAVSMLKSSGFVDYDTKIKAGIRTWRYKPYLINGQAKPVCTAYTFIYRVT